MGKYRPLYKKIWKDPDFEDYSPECKLIFIYLCTNDATSESGVYPISIKTITAETGLPKDIVSKIILNGSMKNILYDQERKVVFVRKLRRYNTGGNPELITKAIVNEYQTCRTTLWKEFMEEYPEFATHLQPLGNGSLTEVKPISTPDKHNTNSNITKRIVKNGLETVEEGLDKGLAELVVLYENKISMMTPQIKEELLSALHEYPIDWIKEAIESAYGKSTHWHYIEKILENRLAKSKKKGSPNSIGGKEMEVVDE
jgi:hypothetical protein